MSHYTIYTMPGCPHCVSAKDLFVREDLTFTELSADPKADNTFTKEELIDLVGPVRTLPQIVVTTAEGKFHVGGFTDLVAYFNGAGPELRKLA